MVNTQGAIDELKLKLGDNVLLPGQETYEEVRRLWNGAITCQPAAIVVPENAIDVQAAVGIANRYGLPLSVKGGGHDWAGRALNEGGIVINTKKLKNIRVNVNERTAVVQAGVVGRELVAAIEPYVLAAVTGTVGAVGFAGLTLGGGYGLLSPTYGLSIDNLLNVEIVLADGRLVMANENENPDLFWAVRGGGGNFGVVISLTIRLHTAKPLQAGLILFPWAEAAAVLKGYAQLISSAPDELSIFSGVIPEPDGNPLLFLVPAWYGDTVAGEKQMTAIKQLGHPVMAEVGYVKVSELLGMFDPHVVNGLHYHLQTRWLPELDEQAIAALVKGVTERSSSLSSIYIHHFHGAATRVPLSATAFGIRKPHFMVEVVTIWDPKDAENTSKHFQWAADLSRALAEHAFPGGYPNILGPGEHEQIAHAYGENLPRLQKVKQKYDREHLFRGISIPG